MKIPLAHGDTLIREILLQAWELDVACIYFIPVGETAYSYRVETSAGERYYLKIIDQGTTLGRSIATGIKFSLPLQIFFAEHPTDTFVTPIPQVTPQGTLYATHDALLFALYSFIAGSTADTSPITSALVEQMGEALAVIHALELPTSLRQSAPQDNLDSSFERDLHADILALEAITNDAESDLQELRELVWPQRDFIADMLRQCDDYQARAARSQSQAVLCHGDLWAGNVIPTTTGKLVLLDWDSATLAPPERDAFGYLYHGSAEFMAFDAGYRTINQKVFRWNLPLLRYYAYRNELRNLGLWLHNILHENYSAEQHASDIEMIRSHCLNRFNDVTSTLLTLEQLL